MRFFINSLLVWIVVSVCLYAWGHMTNRDQASVGKAMFFGFVTAIISILVMAAIVLLF